MRLLGGRTESRLRTDECQGDFVAGRVGAAVALAVVAQIAVAAGLAAEAAGVAPANDGVGAAHVVTPVAMSPPSSSRRAYGAHQELELHIFLPAALDGFVWPSPPDPTATASSTPPVATRQPSPTAATGTPLATPTPTTTPTETASPSPSATATPPVSPTPTATATATLPPGPDWLRYVNSQRRLASLPPVTQDATMSMGAGMHSRYMVKNDVIGHSETPGNPWYSESGDTAARQGNVFVSGQTGQPPQVPIDAWMTGPFHMLGIIDPKLLTSGYGSYSEAVGTFHFGATLNVLGGRNREVSAEDYPVAYPAEGSTARYLRYDGNESPDPLTSCPGFSAPTGPPIALQLGPGSVTPGVVASGFSREGVSLEHCVFDERTYRNPSSAWQDLGRAVLKMRSAVILMPRDPIAPGRSYDVFVETGGTRHSWRFAVAAGSTFTQGGAVR